MEAPGSAPGVEVEIDWTPNGLICEGHRGDVRLGRLKASQEVVAVKLRTRADEGGMVHVPSHPGFVGVRARVVEHGRVFDVRELCTGGELFDMLVSPVGVCVEHKLRWLSDMASVLAHCHSHSMAYGQLRAEDCLLNGAFEIKLKPPKFAVLASPVVDLHREVTVYDAPELQGQARVSAAALFACDVWALGMLSAVLMCGTAAILNPSVIQSSLLASDDNDSCASAAATLRELLSRMLAAAPQERPDMKEVANVTRRCCAQAPPRQMIRSENGDDEMNGCVVDDEMAQSVPPGASPYGAAAGSCPPLRPKADTGFIRCGGWDDLRRPVHKIVGSLQTALSRCGKDFFFDAKNFAFAVYQAGHDGVEPAALDETPPAGRPVAYSINIFSARTLTSFHVVVRRRRLDRFAFMRDYDALREQLVIALGLDSALARAEAQEGLRALLSSSTIPAKQMFLSAPF